MGSKTCNASLQQDMKVYHAGPRFVSQSLSFRLSTFIASLRLVSSFNRRFIVGFLISTPFFFLNKYLLPNEILLQSLVLLQFLLFCHILHNFACNTDCNVINCSHKNATECRNGVCSHRNSIFTAVTLRHKSVK